MPLLPHCVLVSLILRSMLLSLLWCWDKHWSWLTCINTEIKEICNSFPDPRNNAFVDVLKRTSCYAQVTGPDFRTILLWCLKKQFAEEELICAFVALDSAHDIAPSSNAQQQPNYLWVVPNSLN